MSAEVITGVAAGAGMAGLVLGFDQSLAMAAVGGCAFFLGVSVAIPLQTRFFFGIGSCIFGYIIGLMLMSYAGWEATSAAFAFFASALGSSVFGSLHKWADGGPTPRWILFLVKLMPFSLKKGGGTE